jgi:hypothetical protein
LKVLIKYFLAWHVLNDFRKYSFGFLAQKEASDKNILEKGARL